MSRVRGVQRLDGRLLRQLRRVLGLVGTGRSNPEHALTDATLADATGVHRTANADRADADRTPGASGTRVRSTSGASGTRARGTLRGRARVRRTSPPLVVPRPADRPRPRRAEEAEHDAARGHRLRRRPRPGRADELPSSVWAGRGQHRVRRPGAGLGHERDDR
ncbi:hypothetical protein AB0I98_15100 [Streptomyces sp. NPDC050211]|uniref:hypothetical protein n=1 Tax=Streptomyces sp. NPDC050211 TaxID=3154932 RepID=UPI00341BC9C4